MTNATHDVRRSLKAGDLPGAVRALRPHAGTASPAELAKATRGLAEAAGFADLAEAARAAAKKPRDPGALYAFGYACVERGVSFVAVTPLRHALALLPGSRKILAELVTALEDEHRHAEAATLLAERAERLPAWPETYLLVHNTLLAGDFDGARAAAVRLPAPEDDTWLGAHGRQRRMLGRAELARAAGGLDHADLRGWHFGLTGALLGTLSPYGYAAGMTGRYAFLGDSPALARRGLDRLALALAATGQRPTSVSLLPGRSDRILGLAAASVFGLPALPYDPARTDTVVVAHDLNAGDPGLVATLRTRADGQILYEHATCWTGPPPVSADFSALLCQYVVAPWAAHGDRAADERPEEEVARDVVAADPAPDGGDGLTPADPDREFLAYAAAVAPGWLGGTRDRVGSPGPVPSSRFG
ncbi:hypothetical protein [Streptomyces sp. G-G2]|uniref:hypothetical protein n=1 Tax=Streptomyces sp. G-G2 TaxID=3046201 RepID=UPI0024B9DB03|nr:hypothetical protein [Streptomyces sp. G-G2]MDJ0382793.1 hypothetical protein [Streptomyces sp. G-G2]